MPDRSRAVKALGGAVLAVGAALSLIGGARATPTNAASESALIPLLRHGGYVMVMRHAHAPAQPPPAAEADPANTGRERQLDAAGRESASAMGAALRRLHIPIGEVWSSPTYRARETVRLAGLPAPHLSDELGDKGHSMQAAGEGQAAWLRSQVNRPPKRGTDTVIVTHDPNMRAAFGQQADGLGDGEAMIFRPRRSGSAEFVGRVPVGDWPLLAGG